MTDPQIAEIAAKLTAAQRRAITGWRWVSWARLHTDNRSVWGTGLVDVRRFPNNPLGVRKVKLNSLGQSVAAYLKEQSRG